jgi:spermidine synthase
VPGVTCRHEDRPETCDDARVSHHSRMADPAAILAPGLSPATAAGLTFLAAACVLVLEIAAVRLLAPFVGVTLTTYTAIIGVILAGIALGAWVGGRAADRFGPLPLLGPVVVAGGLAAMASVPVVSLVGELGIGAGPVAVILLAGLGFVAPATLLSAVAPMIVRATLTDLASSGSLVGRLSAIGTAGAITGTFLTGFVLLGLVPTRWLILGVGALLVVIGTGLSWRHSRPGAGPLVGMLAVVALGGLSAVIPDRCDRESSYYCIAVVHDPLNADGRTLLLDRVRHAYVDLSDPSVLEFQYVRWFEAASQDLLTLPGHLDALHVGGGGFSFPRHLAESRPTSNHTVLELDAEVTRAARDELGLTTGERIEVIHGDARLSIEGLPDDAFDLVIGDAFGGLAVPWHLTTVEFLDQVVRVLRPGGRYIVNLIDGPALAFARAKAATLGTRFTHVAILTTSGEISGTGAANVVLVASRDPLPVAEILGRAVAGGDADTIVLSAEAVAEFSRGAPILRDDFAPVDQLIGR